MKCTLGPNLLLFVFQNLDTYDPLLTYKTASRKAGVFYRTMASQPLEIAMVHEKEGFEYF